MAEPSDALRHLLLSFPDLEIGEPEGDALQSLVLSAVVHLANGGQSGLISIEEVTRTVHERAGLAFESSEIQGVLEELEKSDQVAFTDRGRRTVFVPDAARRQMATRVSARRDLEEFVRAEWVGDFLSRHEDADGTTASQVWDGMRRVVAHMMNVRSAEAASFLYIERPDARLKFEAAVSESRGIAEDVIESGPLHETIRTEAVRFIRDASGRRSEYLVSLLSAAFSFHLLSLDPGASQLVRSVIQGKIFYVDTNFLFRLLALHGPQQAHAPAMIVDLADDMDCDICVARCTLEEFKSTVRYRTKDLRKHWLRREDFRRIVAEYPTTDVDFMAQFYREQQSGLVMNVDEFERKYLQIERAVEDWEIEIHEEWAWDEDHVRRVGARSQAMYRWHQTERTHAACDHDAMMEVYIREARADRRGGLNEIDVWFLTYDRRLTRFAYSNPIDDEVPFPMLAGDWLQIIRPFLPRTSDYNEAFMSLIATPLLVDDKAVPLRHVVGALERLEKYTGLSERVVAGMVAEQEFVRRLNQITDEEEERELVELKVARAASDLEERMARVEERLNRREAEKKEAEAVVAELRSVLDDRESALATRETQLKNSLESQRAAKENENRTRARAERFEETATGLESTTKKLRIALSVAVVAVVALGVFLAIPLVGSESLMLVVGSVTLVGAFFCLVGMGWVWEKKELRTLGFWIGALAFLAAIWGLMVSQG